MIIEIKKNAKKDRYESRCHLGVENFSDWIQLYESNVQFVGELIRLENNMFIFELDRITRLENGGCVDCLSATTTYGLNMMKKALTYDFGLEPTDYEIISVDNCIK